MHRNDIRNWRLWVSRIIPLFFLVTSIRFEFPVENIGLSYLGGFLCGSTITVMVLFKVFDEFVDKEL